MSDEEGIGGIYLYVDAPEIYWSTSTRETYFLSWEIEAVEKKMWIGNSCCLRSPQVLAPSGARKGRGVAAP